ncbi:ATP-binding protein [Cyanobacterium sp. Dongsha4]|uniref:ATP-binding protein n=1 Tax=Cyanobacterium sp. DS4 TaxID=2878255 RepID=UPI002E822FD5|nr:ATP-binding protein [Cyanobacterium sp. Dongsha4]WVL00206.1 ATP-binding protein [Cyanobacterium sp. Dongsha4]
MSQILEDLTISGFRGFREINLSDMGNINIIVGNNNSGKTSILEAIALFCNPLDPVRWFEISKRSFYSARALRYRPDLESIQWIFQKQETSSNQEESYQKLIIKANGNTSIKELNAKIEKISGIKVSEVQDNEIENDSEDAEIEENIADIDGDIESQGLELNIQTKYLEEDNLIKNQEIKEKFQFWENERFISKKRKQEFINTNIVSPAYSNSVSIVLSRLILEDQKNKDEVLNLIRLFDEQIIDIMILTPKHFGNLYIKHEKLGLPPLDIFGDGIKKTITMALALQSAKNGILLIDEIETSIHVSALNKIFSWLVKSCLQQNIQLIVTTHSIEAVDAMISCDNSVDNIVAFQLNNTDNSVKRFSGDLLTRLRLNRGLDIR